MAVEIIGVSQERRDAGYKLLLKTDELGLNASGAGWYQSIGSTRWKFFLVTPLIDSQGPDWVYHRLLSGLRVISFPDGIKPLEIHLVSPREARFHDLQQVLDVPDLAAKNLYHVSNEEVQQHGISAMVIYRMRSLDRKAGERARIFDARVKELLAA